MQISKTNFYVTLVGCCLWLNILFLDTLSVVFFYLATSLFYTYWIPGIFFVVADELWWLLSSTVIFKLSKPQTTVSCGTCLLAWFLFRKQRKIFHVNHIYLPQMQNWYCPLLNEMKPSEPTDFNIHFILCVSSMN